MLDIIFFRVGGFFDSATAIQIGLTSNILKVTIVGVVMTLHATFKSPNNCISGISSIIVVDNSMCSASKVDKEISVCSFLRQKTSMLAYMMKHSVLGSTFSGFKGSSEFQSPVKSVSKKKSSTFNLFILKTKPRSVVSIRNLPILVTSRSWLSLWSVDNLAH